MIEIDHKLKNLDFKCKIVLNEIKLDILTDIDADVKGKKRKMLAEIKTDPIELLLIKQG